MNQRLLKVAANFFAILILVALIATPIYFAKNFAQVAGVKSQSEYLVVSQVEKFPGMTFLQNSEGFQITFTKQGSSQAYLGVLIVNNPTSEPKKYTISTNSPENSVFFGQDLQNQLNQISVPPQTSVPVSILSQNSLSSTQTVQFTIQSQ